VPASDRRPDGHLVGDHQLVGGGDVEVDQAARDVFPVCVDEGVLAAQHDGHPLVRGDQSVSGGRDGGQDVLQHHLGAVRVLGQFWVQVSDPPQHPRLCGGFLVGSVAYHFVQPCSDIGKDEI